MGRPFAANLDTMASLIHLKMKYHNADDELVIVSSELSKAIRIYKALNRYQQESEGKAVKMNVASLVRQLRDMVIRPPECKANHFGWIFAGKKFK